MTPAEFAFKTIMASEGKTLRFIDPHVRMFRLGKTSYTPDFEDKEGAYYEVIGTRQAFHANKRKYAAFRAAYPDVKLHIVAPNGHVLGLPRGLQTTERRLFGDADGL